MTERQNPDSPIVIGQPAAEARLEMKLNDFIEAAKKVRDRFDQLEQETEIVSKTSTTSEETIRGLMGDASIPITQKATRTDIEVDGFIAQQTKYKYSQTPEKNYRTQIHNVRGKVDGQPASIEVIDFSNGDFAVFCLYQKSLQVTSLRHFLKRDESFDDNMMRILDTLCPPSQTEA